MQTQEIYQKSAQTTIEQEHKLTEIQADLTRVSRSNMQLVSQLWRVPALQNLCFGDMLTMPLTDPSQGCPAILHQAHHQRQKSDHELVPLL